MRDGYKRSDVGVIPGDWEVSTLGQVCTFENGDRSSNYPSPGSFRQSGIPFINAGHVSDGKISLSEMNFITQEAFERLGGGKVKAGDILFCLRGSLGKFGVVTDNFGLGAIASSLVIVRPKLLALNLNYLGCYFSSSICSRMIDTWAGGAAQPNLGAKELARFSIPIPASLTEQHAIAQAVSDVDALIAGLEKLIAKKRDLKQAAMQQLLTGQTRLPGFSGEWRYAPVHELEVRGLLKLSRGNVISKSDIASTPGEYPIYSSSIHNNGEFGRYGKYMFDEELITWSVDGGGNFFYRPAHKFSVTNVCGFMRAKTESLNHRFLAYQLQQQHRQKSFDYQTKAHPSVVRAEYVVAVPSLDEQTFIAKLLSDMDFEIGSLESRLSKTRDLKQGMMQELLTGRTRLV